MTELTDSQLVKACSSGDKAAFRLLIEKHQKPLFNAAYRITSNREDALDALQNAFLKVHLKLSTFDPSRRFFSWIFKIVVNESLNLVEKRRHDGDDTSLERAMAASSPEQELANSQRDELVQQALMRVKVAHRVVLVLKHFNNLSYQEIAEIVGVPRKTVKSRLFSARQELRQKLQEIGLVGRLGD